MNSSTSAIVALAISILLTACASGSVIVTGKVGAPVPPDQVKLYLEPPEDFEVIGLVNASSDSGWTEQGSVNYAIQELKKRAGKIGANGVLILASGETSSTVVVGQGTQYAYAIPVTAKTVHGKAILVKRPKL